MSCKKQCIKIGVQGFGEMLMRKNNGGKWEWIWAACGSCKMAPGAINIPTETSAEWWLGLVDRRAFTKD